MSRRKQLKIASVVVCLFALLGCSRSDSVKAAGDDGAPSATPAAQDFMMKTAQADLSEIDMARLALKKSDDTDVRDYASMIQSDHTAALEDLSDLMKDRNVPEPKTTTADAIQDLNRMNELTGPEFDREFINMMVADHEKAIEMFHEQVGISLDPDIRKYAEDQIPKLEMHLEKAQRLQSRLFRASR